MNDLNPKYWSYLFLSFFGWLVVGISTFSYSQKYPNIELHHIDGQPNFRIKLPNEASLDSVQKIIKKQYFENGYLGFSIDSIANDGGVNKIFIQTGKKYKVAQIEVSPANFDELSLKYIFHRPFNQKLINSLDFDILMSVQDFGYPYARLEKNIQFANQLVSINYNIKPGSKVVFDSIITSPSNMISHNYISRKTGIEVGHNYNATALKNLEKNINQSQLFTLDSAYTLLSEHQAKIILKLKKVSQNYFNALVGLQPNSDNKTEVIGNATISLSNAFKKGEQIELDWRNSGNKSQQLETSLKLPYIFKLPIGTLFYGNLDKQDTSFTNTQLRIGLLIPTLNNGEWSINLKSQISSVNASYSADFNSTQGTLYGLGYIYSFYDNPLLPKKGFLCSSQVYMGKNYLINKGAENTETLLKEWIGEIQFAFPMPLGSIFIQNEWGVLENDSLKLNNFYRLGGTNSIRGFNERSIYSKAYSFSNAEYRFYLNSESFIYMLFDCGLFNEPVNREFNTVFRQAFGVGLNVKTLGGNLSISYAVGKYGSDPYLINEGKIHMGYINRF